MTKEIRSAKASYDKRLIEESGGVHRSFWKTIKKILPGEKKATSPNIKVDGVVSVSYTHLTLPTKRIV